MKLILIFMKDLLIDSLNTFSIILLSWLTYKLIERMYIRLNIRDYVYNEEHDEFADKVKIMWFSANDKSENKLLYRFKDEKSGLLIFINKLDITFCDRLRMICYFYKTRNNLNKILPEFLVKKYIFPYLLQIKHNNSIR